MDWIRKNRVWVAVGAAVVVVLIVAAVVNAQTGKPKPGATVNLAGGGYQASPGGVPSGFNGSSPSVVPPTGSNQSGLGTSGGTKVFNFYARCCRIPGR